MGGIETCLKYVINITGLNLLSLVELAGGGF